MTHRRLQNVTNIMEIYAAWGVCFFNDVKRKRKCLSEFTELSDNLRCRLLSVL